MENAKKKAGYPIHSHDVIIVGAGLTGLRAAIETVNRGLDTAIVSKVHPLRSHSVAAQGGINAALGNAVADVSWNPENEVLVEPLPSLPKVKDLIVDMDKFFEFYRAVEPTFKPASEPPERDRLMLANSKFGWWGCEFHANCRAVCPKGVPPIEGIGKARKEIKELGKKPD